MHYIAIILVCLFIILVSNASELVALSGKDWELWRRYAHPWKHHTAGQLHRKVAKQRYGDVGENNLEEDYPPLSKGLSGMDFQEPAPAGGFEYGKLSCQVCL